MLGFYFRIVIIVAIALILYGGVLPHMVSARDTLLVLLGIVLALVYPALAGKYIWKHYRKTFNA